MVQTDGHKWTDRRTYGRPMDRPNFFSTEYSPVFAGVVVAVVLNIVLI